MQPAHTLYIGRFLFSQNFQAITYSNWTRQTAKYEQVTIYINNLVITFVENQQLHIL